MINWGVSVIFTPEREVRQIVYAQTKTPSRLAEKTPERKENKEGGHFMDKVEEARKEASEEATRESLIAISYHLPEKKDLAPEHKPENLNKSEDLVNGKIKGDGEEKNRSELISISYSESPDTKSVPVAPGEIKG